MLEMFFTGFTFDTLLGLLSVIIGVLALIVGGKAYNNCRELKTTFKDKKKFADDSQDHSQQAGGDIINYAYDVNALATITNANFETALTKANEMFAEQNKANLQEIIEKTNKLIHDNKINLAGMTKIDWINVYFESAKNTSDTYMQNVWAQVLAKELESPGSFSYKTLDVLKNMSSNDFHLFEKLSMLEISGWILQEDLYSKHGVAYLELVRLSDYGLLNMGFSQNTYTIPPHETINLVYKTLLILMKNPTDEEIKINTSVFLLTSVATELLQVISNRFSEEYAKDCIKVLLKHNNQVNISLHRINYVTDKEINYQTEDLFIK